MKRLFIIPLLSILAILTSCTTKSFTIDGKVDGLSGKVYLVLLQGKTPQIIDSTQATTDGAFVFKGKVERPMMSLLQNAANQTFAMFMLENSPIEVFGSISEPDSIKVIGSHENDLYRAVATQSAMATNASEQQGILREFINANPNSYAAGYVLFRELSPYIDYTQMREIASTLDTTIQSSIYIQKLLERAATLEATSVGKQFVDFSSTDTNGQPVALSSVAGKGDWVLLDFWASWCGPCRAENPHVVKAYNMFKDRGFTVFGYSLDRKDQDWKRGIEKDSLNNWTNASDLAFWESAPAATYGVGSIPSNVLINEQGVIVARNLRGDELIEYLDSNLPIKK